MKWDKKLWKNYFFKEKRITYNQISTLLKLKIKGFHFQDVLGDSNYFLNAEIESNRSNFDNPLDLKYYVVEVLQHNQYIKQIHNKILPN